MKRTMQILMMCCVAAPSLAANVFINDVNIEGMVNQRLENVTVEIDAKGDVHIVAKNIKVQQVDVPPKSMPPTPAPAPAPAPVATTPTTTNPGSSAPARAANAPVPTRKYFLASEHVGPGMAQYDIDVFINGAWVRRVLHSEGQVVLDLTPYLQVGKNAVHLSAQKKVGAERMSTSPMHKMTLHIGEGHGNGTQVSIDDVQIEYSRNASEVKNFEDDLTLLVR
jgi:hypothetical protein